jgi:membrane protein
MAMARTTGIVAHGDSVNAEAQQDASGPLAALRRFHASMLARHRAYALIAEIALAVKEQQPSLLAKQTAYSLLYAVPSILIVLVSLAAIVDKNTGFGVSEALQQFIAEQAPDELQPLLASLVQYALVETSEQTAIVAAIISLAIALWSAAGGVGALVYAVNEVYDIKDKRSFLKGAAIRLGLMVLGGILVVAAFLLLAFGRLVLDLLPDIADAGGLLPAILASSPLWALVMLFVSIVLLYWFGLDAPKSLRWLLPGAVAASVAIALLAGLLELILSYSNPGAAYGVAGSVLILLWTLFMVSNIVVIGAIVNAVLGTRHDRTLIAGLQSRPPEMPTGKRIAVSTYR